MINLAIISSSNICRPYLYSLAQQFVQRHFYEMNITTFDAGQKFLEQYQHDIDIVIIDSELDDMDGYDVAKQLRAMDSGLDIIFVSESDLKAIEGYQVGAQAFFIKPPKFQQLAQQLQECINNWESKRDRTIMIAYGTVIQRIFIDDIIYLSSYQHRTILHTHVESRPIVCSLVKFEERIPKHSGLIRVNSGYIVNLQYVKALQDNTILLTNGQTVPVSRPRKTLVKDALRAYYADQQSEQIM